MVFLDYLKSDNILNYFKGETKERMSCEEHLRTLALSSLEKRRLNSDLIVLPSFLRRGSGRGDAELFFLVSSDRKHGNGSKLC